MPESPRYASSMRSGYDSDDRHSRAYGSVRKYRVKTGRVEEITVPRYAPRSDRIEIDHRGDRFSISSSSSSFDHPRVLDTITRGLVQETRQDQRYNDLYELDRGRQPGPDLSGRWEQNHPTPWEADHEDRKIAIRITNHHDDSHSPDRYQAVTNHGYDYPSYSQSTIARHRSSEPREILVQRPSSRQEQHQLVLRERDQENIRDAISELRIGSRDESDYHRHRKHDQGSNLIHNSSRSMGRVSRSRVRHSPSRDSEYTYYEDSPRRAERSQSTNSHHRRHLAEGALAGAGVSALLASNNRNKHDNRSENPGFNMLGGAALGAIGAEVLTRAQSHNHGHYHAKDRSRSSSRDSPRHVKSALGIAAASIAAAAATHFVQSHKENHEGFERGRSRTLSRSKNHKSYHSQHRSQSRSHSKRRDQSSVVAKAGAASAAVTGLIQHAQNEAQKRDGHRSRSRLRRGAEVAGVGLAGAAVASLLERDQREMAYQNRSRSRERGRNESRKRSRSAHPKLHSRSASRMVQYGTDPVYANRHSHTTFSEDRPRSHSRRRRDHSSYRKNNNGSRSQSRIRDILGSAAAAIGVKHSENYDIRNERSLPRSYSRANSVSKHRSRTFSN
ncbi:unnamed protein product [Blumeria hordei]|uniref:DUF3824 domain-containing protein n=1 Tax=Blumeria hordei TaxID=2867405 RepID=A0A383UX41_BLUHO|nr:unnamed protein product [Blumeria hordei]